MVKNSKFAFKCVLPVCTGFDAPYIKGLLDVGLLTPLIFSEKEPLKKSLNNPPLKMDDYVFYTMKINSPDLFEIRRKKE